LIIVINLLTIDEAFEKAGMKRHLLLGNGFSIALKPNIFSYESLYKNADFSKADHIPKLFDLLETKDFEAVIRLLVSMAKIVKAYPDLPESVAEQIREDAETIKNVLAEAIAKNHPKLPFDIEDEQYAHCRAFLDNFANIYTLNYDVLLYWTLMNVDVDEIDIDCDDGFRHPEGNEDAPYVSWQQAHRPTVYYLHGALHLFDAGHEITKYTWSKTRTPIVEQIRLALDEEKYPLFVAEGNSEDKLEKIMHNAYLHKGLRSFESIGGSLFVFGHSFDDNDDHIIGKIPFSKVQKLFVGLFGNPVSEQNREIIRKANRYSDQRSQMPRKRPLEVFFYDVSSAQVWG